MSVWCLTVGFTSLVAPVPILLETDVRRLVPGTDPKSLAQTFPYQEINSSASKFCVVHLQPARLIHCYGRLGVSRPRRSPGWGTPALSGSSSQLGPSRSRRLRHRLHRPPERQT